MKKKRIWVIMIVAAVLVAAGIGFVSDRKGDVSRVQRSIGESGRYTEEEIGAAMDAVETYFRKNFEGCQLLELSYGGLCEAEELEWEESYGVEQVIVLTSTFYVKPNGADGSLNQDDTYTGWKWIMARTEDGAWEHRDHGY